MRLYNIFFFLTVGILSCGVVNTSSATDHDTIVSNVNYKTYEEIVELCKLTENGDKAARHELFIEYPKFLYGYLMDKYHIDGDFDELYNRVTAIVQALAAKKKDITVLTNNLINFHYDMSKHGLYSTHIFDMICELALSGDNTAKTYTRNNYQFSVCLTRKIKSGNRDAFNILEEAAKLGNHDAISNMGWLALECGNVDAECCLIECAKKYDDAFDKLATLASIGSTIAMDALIKYAENGNEQAISSLQKICFGGNNIDLVMFRAFNCLVKLKRQKAKKAYATHEAIMFQWANLKELMKIYEAKVVALPESERRIDNSYTVPHDKLLGLFDAQTSLLDYVIGITPEQ